MATASAQLPEQQPTIAQVSDRTRKPEGVVSRRSQQYVIMGIAVVIVLIAMFSSNRQRRPVSAAQSGLAPMVREGNERKVADYGQQLGTSSAERWDNCHRHQIRLRRVDTPLQTQRTFNL